MNRTTGKNLISLILSVLILAITSCNGDNEGTTPELSINASTITEGNEGITLLKVEITSSILVEESLEITYNTSDGLAKAGKDYNEVNNGSVVIPSGNNKGTIEIDILTDEIMEFREDFSINILNTGNAEINTNKVTINILDDDDETYEIQKDADGYITPDIYPEMSLAWSDEFDGPAINTNDWTFELGDGCPNVCGWGNNYRITLMKKRTQE